MLCHRCSSAIECFLRGSVILANWVTWVNPARFYRLPFGVSLAAPHHRIDICLLRFISQSGTHLETFCNLFCCIVDLPPQLILLRLTAWSAKLQCPGPGVQNRQLALWYREINFHSTRHREREHKSGLLILSFDSATWSLNLWASSPQWIPTFRRNVFPIQLVPKWLFHQR